MPFGSILSTIASVGQKLGSVMGGEQGQGLMNLLGLGTAGAGLVGNILNQKARSDELNYLKNQQKALADPTALAKQVAAATQPLSTGLVQGVENQVSSSLAEQGLSQAPGIQAAALSQALAPFYQQNQNTALQLVMERLGLPLSYASTYLQGLPQNANMAPLLALLNKNAFGGGSPSTGGQMTPGSMAQIGADLGWNPAVYGSPYGSVNLGVGDTTSPASFPWVPDTGGEVAA